MLEADEAAGIEEVQAWAAGLDALHARTAGRFVRAEPRRRALAHLKGLLGNVGRKNGWQLAEHAGERTPDGMQRLLATAGWDADRVRDDLRGYVVEHLGDPGAVLVVDETGAKGRRLYDWTRVELAAPAATGMARWLLVRRSRSDGELAYYALLRAGWHPVDRAGPGSGDQVGGEEGFEQAKGEVGLGHYEVRKWPGWYRHVTLALLAHAFLAVTRAKATSPERAKGDTAA